MKKPLNRLKNLMGQNPLKLSGHLYHRLQNVRALVKARLARGVGGI